MISDLKIPLLQETAGGFLVYGILIAIVNKLTEKRGGIKKKSFSCEGCPTAQLCNKSACGEKAPATEESNQEVSKNEEVSENA